VNVWNIDGVTDVEIVRKERFINLAKTTFIEHWPCPNTEPNTGTRVTQITLARHVMDEQRAAL